MTMFWPASASYAPYGPAAGFAPAMGMAPPPQMYNAPQLTGAYSSPEGFPIYCYTLRNGHRVIIEDRPTDAVFLRTFIKAGSVYERPIHNSPYYRQSPHPSGISHLDEHCHFLTTQNFPQKNTWTGAVERYGAHLNASTSEEWIQHELSFNKEDLPAMLDLHAESVLRPKYTAKDLNQEKTNVVNEMSQRTHPVEARVNNKLWELLFDRPQFQTLGSKADVQNTTPEELQRFHDTFYRPDNMITVISGKVNPMAAVAQVDRLFGNNPPRPANYAPEAVKCVLRPNEIRSKTVHDPTLTTSSIVNLAFPAPGATNFRERMAMEFLIDMLGVSPTSLLEQQVKDRQRLASEVVVGYMPMEASGVVDCVLRTSPGQEQNALRSTLQQVRVLSQWSPSPEKLAETRNRLLYSFRSRLNNVEYGTQEMGLEALRGSLDYYLQYEQMLNNITSEDILQTARKYLDPNRYAVVFGVQGPTNSPTGGYHA